MKKYNEKLNRRSARPSDSEILYLAHHAERPQENDMLFHNYKKAEDYIKNDFSAGILTFQ